MFCKRTVEGMEHRPEHAASRTVDIASLKALAHPLRVAILEAVSRYGPQTSGTLAELLGESTGATSYHLRQLAKHDFLREVPGRGTARERWWERPKGSLQVVTRELAENPATREAAQLVSREFENSRAAALADFMERGWLEEPAEWADAAMLSTLNLRLTVEQLADVSARLAAFVDALAEELRTDQPPEGSRAVQLHINAFPLPGLREPRPAAGTYDQEDQ